MSRGLGDVYKRQEVGPMGQETLADLCTRGALTPEQAMKCSNCVLSARCSLGSAWAAAYDAGMIVCATDSAWGSDRTLRLLVLWRGLKSSIILKLNAGRPTSKQASKQITNNPETCKQTTSKQASQQASKHASSKQTWNPRLTSYSNYRGRGIMNAQAHGLSCKSYQAGCLQATGANVAHRRSA